MTSTAKLIRFDLIAAAAVDELGAIKAQIAELKAREEQIKQDLVECGVSEAEGRLFRATVSLVERETTDWKAVAQKLNPSRQLITAHTSSTTSSTVRVSARKTS